jgi:hypothetical protein
MTMIRPSGRCAALAALVALSYTAGPALAQNVAAPAPVPDLTQPTPAPETLSVSQRPHPELDPLGLRVGSFLVSPSLEIGEMYDSNIYGRRIDAVSDWITQIQPMVTVNSDWNRHAASFYARGDISEYADHSSQSMQNFELQATGRLDIQRGSYLEGWAGYQLEHEAPYTPDSQAAAAQAGLGTFAIDPTEYAVEIGHLAYVYSPRRIGIEVAADLAALQFSNPQASNGSTIIESDRSRKEITLTPKLSYELMPGYQAYVQGMVNWRLYDSQFDSSADRLQRTSNGYGGAVGTQFNLSHVITGDIYLGYETQEYDDVRLGSTNGLDFGAKVLWNVTQLTSVSLVASRSIGETILVGSSGFFDTRSALTVEHELLRNLLLTAGVNYERSEYQGINRDDNDYGATAGAQWRFNRNFAVSLTGTVQNRLSNQGDNNFVRETLLLSVKGQI